MNAQVFFKVGHLLEPAIHDHMRGVLEVDAKKMRASSHRPCSDRSRNRGKYNHLIPEMKKLYKQKNSLTSIANQLGLSRQTVTNLLRRSGVI